jgi:hypothetical protein
MKRILLNYKDTSKSGSAKKGGSAPELFFNNFRSRAELKWGEKHGKNPSHTGDPPVFLKKLGS